MAVIMQIFRIHKVPQGMTNGHQRTRVIFALHQALMELKHEVVLIEWTVNWKNYMKVIKYDHGPLHWVQHDRAQIVKQFSATDIEHVFHCTVWETRKEQTHFFSSNHLLTHLRQKMFGCGMHPTFKNDKTQENSKIDEHEIKAALQKLGLPDRLPNEKDDERLARLRRRKPDRRFLEKLNWNVQSEWQTLKPGVIMRMLDGYSEGLMKIPAGAPGVSCGADLLFVKDSKHWVLYDSRKTYEPWQDRIHVYGSDYVSVGVDKRHCINQIKSTKAIWIACFRTIYELYERFEKIVLARNRNRKMLEETRQTYDECQQKIEEIEKSEQALKKERSLQKLAQLKQSYADCEKQINEHETDFQNLFEEKTTCEEQLTKNGVDNVLGHEVAFNYVKWVVLNWNEAQNPAMDWQMKQYMRNFAAIVFAVFSENKILSEIEKYTESRLREAISTNTQVTITNLDHFFSGKKSQESVVVKQLVNVASSMTKDIHLPMTIIYRKWISDLNIEPHPWHKRSSGIVISVPNLELDANIKGIIKQMETQYV